MQEKELRSRFFEAICDLMILKKALEFYENGTQDGGNKAKHALMACKPNFDFRGQLSTKIEAARAEIMAV